MTLRRLIPCVLLLAPLPARAEEHLLPKERFEALAAEYSGERALEAVRRLVEHHRIQGSPMMADVAERLLLPALRAAGLEARIESFPSDGRVRYGTYISPPGWTIRGAELWVERAGPAGAQAASPPLRLCRYADVPMCVSTYSKGGEWSGDLVDVGRGTRDEDYAAADVRGKVALASGYASAVVRKAVLQRGAVGVVIYPRPGDRPEHPDMVRYNGIWPRAEELARTSGGFQISANQYARLRELMRSGPVRARGRIDATLGKGSLTVVHAYLRGAEEREREVLLTAHFDHPKWSANDNASGAGALLELARTLRAQVAAGKLRPRRTIHFLWVPEFYGTLAWASRHPEARRCGPWDDPRLEGSGAGAARGCVLANLNLDMVGEDAQKTGSRFYATRAPDSVPSPLDALLGDVIEQTREARLFAQTGTRHPWQAELVPYAQGSDHDVLLGLGVPATMLGHAPDWTHHTSEDTIDKVDASELLRVGVLSAAAAEVLATAGPAEWGRLGARALGGQLADGAERLGRLLAARRTGALAGAVAPLRARVDAAAAALRSPPAAPRFEDLLSPLPPLLLPANDPAGGPVGGPAGGPRRRAILPLGDELFEDLPAEDGRWVQAQRDRLGEGRVPALLPPPSFEELCYEAVNLLDGRRRPQQIAQALAAEFLLEVDAAWVERLLKILASRGVVELPKQ